MPDAGIRRERSVCTPPVVAMGASAGGLSVLEHLFSRLPRNSGAAYIVLQHLSPGVESRMDSLLRRVTTLPVQQATNDLPIEADHIYLIPPGNDMIVADGRLLLADIDTASDRASPIDRFLCSLAAEREHCAVAVILSGSGSDGSRGIRDVAAAGGLVICQNPEEAEFDSMPRSAVATGVVDLVLHAVEIPEALATHLATLAAVENAARSINAVSLERELESVRNNPHCAVDDLEGVNAALRVSNEELNILNSEHQEKIEELFEVTEDLENLLRSTEVGVLLLDRELNIRRATESAQTLLRILPQDLGRGFAHFAGNLDAPSVLDHVREVLSTRDKRQQELTTKDGRTIQMSILPYRTEGTTTGIVITFVDVSRLAGALADAHRLSAIVQSARAAIVSKDLDGKVLSWNDGAVKLYGYESEAMIGKNISVIFPENKEDELQRILGEIRAGRDVAPYSTIRVRKSGDEIDVLLSVSPVRSRKGEIVGASAIAWDVSDTKLANERALLAVAQRDRFLAVLSHELRNPMMALANANEVLQRTPHDDAVAAQARRIMARQVAQMSRILEDVLDTSRLRQDKIELNRQLIDLRQVLRQALDAVRAHAQTKRMEIDVSIPKEAVHTKADPGRLQQVVVNLGLNAIAHSSPMSRIRFEVEALSDQAILRVKDSGFGISARDLPNVFEPFFQGGREKHDGVGLGLALAQAIAKAHDGRITASSEGEGKGAEFELFLPIADTFETTNVDPAALGAADSRATVLLVDDDDDARETLALLLRRSNYEVLEAGDGASGIEAILSTKPSVAIVDIGLPDISGFEVARKIREDIGPQVVRLIALTGYGQQTDREAAIEAGFDMHLVKPLAFETLEKVIAYQASR